MSIKVNLWTLYKNTTDYPGEYVARRFEYDKATPDHFSHADINVVREWIKTQALALGVYAPHRFPRSQIDDPVIIETWL